MTLQAVYNVIIAYVKAHSSLTCVQAFQNSPPPKAPYIAISRPTVKVIGTSQSIYSGSTAITETTRTQYEGSLSIWAIAGDSPSVAEYASDILRRVFSLQNSTASKLYFANAGVALVSLDGPNDVPRLNDESFINEAICTLRFTFASDATELVTTIDHSITTGTVTTPEGEIPVTAIQ